MKRIVCIALLLASSAVINSACDAKKDPVGSGREAVKEVVTQPLQTLDAAKDSLKKGEDKSKAAIDELDKETK